MQLEDVFQPQESLCWVWMMYVVVTLHDLECSCCDACTVHAWNRMKSVLFNKEKIFHVSYCCSNIWEDEKNGVKVGNGVAAARIVCVSCQSQAKLLCECYLAKFFSGLHM
jgi:hypothetical protein